MSATTNYTEVDRVRALAAFEVSADEHLALCDDDAGEAGSWERCRDRIHGVWAELPSGWQDEAVLWPAYLVARREYLRESLAVMP
jgi:hypothetical protein